NRLSTQELKDIGIYPLDEPVDPIDKFYESNYVRIKDGSQPYDLDFPERVTSSTSVKYLPETTQGRRVTSLHQSKDGKIPFSVSKKIHSPVKAPGRELKEPPSSECVSAALQSQYNPHGVILHVDRQQSRSTLVNPSINIISAYARSLRQSFVSTEQERSLVYVPRLPSTDEIVATMWEGTRPSVIYQDPFYSNEDDVPNYRREYAGKDLCRETKSIYNLPSFDLAGPPDFTRRGIRFDPRFNDKLEEAGRRMRKQCSIRVWEFMPTLPTLTEVLRFFQTSASPVQHVTQKAICTRATRCPLPIYKNVELSSHPVPEAFDRLRSFCSQGDTIMSLEVHVNTRQHFMPDPKRDEVQCIFLAIQPIDTLEDDENLMLVVITLKTKLQRTMLPKMNYVLFEEDTELDLINKLVDVVRCVDPEILTGYEIHGGSWGYVIERARELYDYSLCDEISRVLSQAHGSFGRENDRWGFEHSCSVRITGRNIINIWRAMRSELTLLQYTMENVVFHLFKQRIPHYHFQDLTSWFNSDIPRHRAITVGYIANRVCLDLKILAANETISRTQEQARILGIDFASVILRGSQFKVESLMFRIAKPENYMLVSPSREQVGQENALECQPLIMEPQSAFYASPVVVLDFQSLYPSVVIAHNYCYSTCLGRVSPWRGRNKIGFLDLDVDDRLLASLKAHVDIAPNGILYAKPNVRKSLLARMLAEILETRVMVKNSMKEHRDDKTIQRLLNNRQLALKYIANVTYGYTSAAFSGRMPCVEIADSIVSTGREILEKAIAMIHSDERWGAEVVYGDTDSLFIHLKGRTREEAFAIGEEIAEAITSANPSPIKLKFEKVYHPCLLQSKKRYVGYKFEGLAQKEPVFDAKGIETIRRDGTPLQQATVDKVLKILFDTADLSLIKEYFQEQCADIIRGNIPVGDFTFAKEVKLGKYKSEGTAPPGALVSAQRMLEDRRLEPQYGERVPYVVIAGEPGTNLAFRCVAPETFLRNPGMTLDAHYYISKNLIPSLSRILNLVGADVSRWYYDMPRVRLPHTTITDRSVRGAAMGETMMQEGIDQWESAPSFRSSVCIVCQNELSSVNEEQNMCRICRSNRHESLLRLNVRLRDIERQTVQLQAISRSVMGVPFGDHTRCDNKDSPLFYARMKAEHRLNTLHAQLEAAMNHLGSAKEEQLEW
ncbi:DNA polymerase zeta, partial [Ascosphaera aggregata]